MNNLVRLLAANHFSRRACARAQLHKEHRGWVGVPAFHVGTAFHVGNGNGSIYVVVPDPEVRERFLGEVQIKDTMWWTH